MTHDEAVEYVRNNLTVDQVWPDARRETLRTVLRDVDALRVVHHVGSESYRTLGLVDWLISRRIYGDME